MRSAIEDAFVLTVALRQRDVSLVRDFVPDALEHLEIAAALRARNGPTASALLATHALRIMDQLLQAMAQPPPRLTPAERKSCARSHVPRCYHAHFGTAAVKADSWSNAARAADGASSLRALSASMPQHGLRVDRVNGSRTRRHHHRDLEAADPSLRPPYVVAVVRLEEQYTMLTNIVDVDTETDLIDSPVRVRFQRESDEITLPVFELAFPDGNHA